MSSIEVETMEVVEEPLELPPGFRFHPSDEEIINHYLMNKAMNEGFQARAIGEADFNRSEPWDLPGKAKMGEKEWYFFCRRERRYPTGMRTNRATLAGYWKATGKDKEIYKGKNCLVGMKKTLVFYKGRAPKGEKTNWVMHEYRLEGNFSHFNIPPTIKDSWVVCRVFHKSSGLKKAPEEEDTRADSQDDYFSSSSIPAFLESPHYDPNDGSSYFLEERDFKSIPSSSSSSSYPSYLPSTMDMGNIQAFQSSTAHQNPLQINPFNAEKRPVGYPQAYHYFQTLPNAGVYIPERNRDFSLQEKAILRGPAAVSQPTGGVPLDKLIEHR